MNKQAPNRPDSGKVVSAKQRKVKFTDKELVKMFRSLASMLRAQITTADALNYYSKGLPNKALAQVLLDIRQDINNGVAAHEAFRKREVFDPMIVGLVQAGTESARLDEAFAALAKHFTTQAHFKKQIKSATIVPCIVITVLSCAFVYAMTSIVPMVKDMLASVKQEPDSISAIIFKIADLTKVGWFPAFIAIVVFILLMIFVTKFRFMVMNLIMARWRMMRLMIMSLRQMTVLSTAYLLNSNGINLAKALRVGAQTVKSTPMYDELITAADKYEHTGLPLALSIQKFTSCDEQVSHMIGIGEKSSSVANQLRLLAEMYEEDADNYMKEFSQMVSFLVTLLAAGLIGMVMVGTYLPIVLMGPKMMKSRM